MTARMPIVRSTDAAAARRKPDCEAVWLNYFLERKLVAALQQDPRYVIKRNVTIPTTPESRIAVRRANGGYIGMSLRSDGDANLLTNVKLGKSSSSQRARADPGPKSTISSGATTLPKER
jgi:hypothetical protein